MVIVVCRSRSFMVHGVVVVVTEIVFIMQKSTNTQYYAVNVVIYVHHRSLNQFSYTIKTSLKSFASPPENSFVDEQ